MESELKFEEVVKYSDYLRGQLSARNAQNERMDDIYRLRWEQQDQVNNAGDNVKLTISTDARNAIKGAIRLLIASDPTISVPFEENDDQTEDYSEHLEKAAKIIWSAAGRMRGDPVHYDIVRTALMYDEYHIELLNTSKLLEQADKNSGMYYERLQEIAAHTPILYDVNHPNTGYPAFGRFGLTAFHKQVQTTQGEVVDQYGEDARRVFGAQYSRYATTTLNSFWDTVYQCIWIEGSKFPLIKGYHKMPVLPIVAGLVEGSMMADAEEERREPFLYTIWKSGIWNRQNLSLTVLYTIIFSLLANPMYKESVGPNGERVKYEWSNVGGKIVVPQGSNYEQFIQNGILDPRLMEALSLADTKSQESTIYSQTLGEPLGGNAPYSMVALLNQAGRLPLTVPQRKGGWGIADALRAAFKMIKAEGGKKELRYENQFMDLDVTEIPDFFEIQAKLDVALPQDKLNQANVAQAVTNPNQPLASIRWTRENVLNIGQSDKMQEEIWTEQAASIMFQGYVQDQIQLMKQMEATLQQKGVDSLAPSLAHQANSPEVCPQDKKGRRKILTLRASYSNKCRRVSRPKWL